MASNEFDHNPTLEALIAKCQPHSDVYLYQKQLIDRDMRIVVKQAMINKQCTKLWLGQNKITSKGVAILADALYNNKTLEALDLSATRISDRGVGYLAKALSVNSSILKILDLGSNGITHEGTQHLAEMLKTNRTLTHLWLYNNELGDRGVKLLTNVLGLHNTTLEWLHISNTKLMSDACVDSLVEMLKHNQSLKQLWVRECNLSKTSNRRLQEAASAKRGFTLFIDTEQGSCVIL